MAKFFEQLSFDHIEFIQRQSVFFVATAPPIPDGRINLSPKGMDTFRVLDNRTVAYLDLTGSGNETAAHVRHDPNHRITIMMCSFDEKPLIFRIYGRGEVVAPDHPRWNELSAKFPELPGTRQIILVHMLSGQTSCGFAVPVFTGKQERTMLTDWAVKKGEDAIRKYQLEKNSRSIDGLETGIAR